MNSKIVQFGAPVLTQSVAPIDFMTDDHVKLIKRMKMVLSLCSDGIALAAPQIGASEPIFIYKADGKINTIINPVLAAYDDELWLFNEGCLSIPGYTWPIWRPKKVLLRGINVDGGDVRIEAQDLLGRIFQHEMDHLFGKLIVDHLSEEERQEFISKWKPKTSSTKKKKR